MIPALVVVNNVVYRFRCVWGLQLKLGLSLMKLAFSLESWEACGGDHQLSGPDALAEGNRHIDTALEIFKEVNNN